MRKRRRVSGRGCVSARAGSKAGCRHGWCICEIHAASRAISACAAFSRFSSYALAALVHPLFLCGLIYGVLSEAPMWKSGGATAAILAVLYGITLTIGYATSALLGWLGLARRGLLSTAWVLVLTPLHWLLLSLAAWRALFQLVMSPYRWEKTEHGLAKSSQREQRLTHVLLQLERLLRGLKETGNLTALPAEPTYTSAARRPTPQAAA
jgi:hypothetical protein